MAGRSIGAKPGIALKLPQLQNLIKRDPMSYKEEFEMQWRHYQSELAIYKLRPVGARDKGTGPEGDDGGGGNGGAMGGADGNEGKNKDSSHFGALVSLMSHVAHCYPTKLGPLADELTELLDTRAAGMTPRLRMTLVQSLILLRHRGLLSPVALLPVLLRMLRVEDRKLREMIEAHVVSDVTQMHQKHRDERTHRALQVVLYDAVSSCKTAAASAAERGGQDGGRAAVSGAVGDDDDDGDEVLARRALQMLRELYRRRVWTDVRTVNAIAAALGSGVAKLVAISCRFFLGIEERMALDVGEEEAEEIEDVNHMNLHQHSKKTKKRLRQKEKALKNRATKLRNAQERVHGKATPKDEDGNDIPVGAGDDPTNAEAIALFPAMQMLHDPQGVAEMLFGALKRRHSNESFEFKLLLLNFVSRLIGVHRLMLLPFYGYVQRYLGQHQRSIASVLAYCVQGCHDRVPPDELQPIVRTIAHSLVADRCNDESVAVGINSIREITARCPLVMEGDEMKPILDDIITRAKSREKSVMVAARAFLNLLRESNPTLLHRRMRGRAAAIRTAAGKKPTALQSAEEQRRIAPARYGELQAADEIDGVALLEEAEQAGEFDSEGEAERRRDQIAAEEEDGASSGWEDVSDDEEGEPDEGWRAWLKTMEPKKLRKRKRQELEDEVEELANGGGGGGGRAERDELADADLSSLKVAELREELSQRGLDTAGLKAALLERLQAAVTAGSGGGGADDDDMDDSEDEFEDEEEDADDMEDEARPAKKPRGSNRILTAEDFARIRMLKTRAKEEAANPRLAKAALAKRMEMEQASRARLLTHHDSALVRQAVAVSGAGIVDSSDAVAPEDLHGVQKKKKASLAARLQTMQERTRDKFGAKDRSTTGTTNNEKRRTKNYLMVQKSQTSKKKITRCWKQVNAKGRNSKTNKPLGVLQHDAKKRRRAGT